MEFIFKVVLLFAFLTYIVWGFIFGIHSMLVLSGSKTAKRWAKFWYSKKGYVYECYIFFPMIYFVFVLVEFMPYIVGLNRDFKGFDFEKLKDISFMDKV